MAAILEAPVTTLEEAIVIPRKRWTRAEYRQLTKDNFLQDGKVELINGEIWEKMGHGRRHTFVVTRIFKLLGMIFGFDRLQTQSSLPINEDSEPEPDLALLLQDLDHYLEDDPTSAETLLVVEAANTTLRTDLTVKQVMYAQSGIPEYWVVDIPNQLLHVFREPTVNGYAERTVLTPTDEVHPLAAPDSVIQVAELLP